MIDVVVAINNTAVNEDIHMSNSRKPGGLQLWSARISSSAVFTRHSLFQVDISSSSSAFSSINLLILLQKDSYRDESARTMVAKFY